MLKITTLQKNLEKAQQVSKCLVLFQLVFSPSLRNNCRFPEAIYLVKAAIKIKSNSNMDKMQAHSTNKTMVKKKQNIFYK